MGKVRLLIAVISLVACGKSDNSNGAPAAGTPASAITPADLAGTLDGQAMAQGSDSVLFRFTCVQRPGGNDSRCVTAAAPNDTTIYGFSMSGDSVMWTSATHASTTLPAKPQVVDHLVGRMYGRKWVGSWVTALASKPDSVLMRMRWEATKAR